MNKENNITNIGLLNILLIIAIGVLPINLMLFKKGPSAIYYLVCFISLLLLFINKWKTYLTCLSEYKWFMLAMAAPVISIIFSGLVNGHIPGQDVEYSSRFLLVALLLMPALTFINQKHSKYIIWFFLIAAVCASFFIINLSWPSWGRPNTNDVFNAVGYGSLTLLLTTISFFSIKWQISAYPRLELIIKIAITLVAFFAVVLTQTRTAWLAMPLFVVIAAGLFTKQAKPRKIILISLIAFSALSAFFVTNDTLRNRAVTAYNEVVECQNVDSLKESSLCIRIQLWRASLDMLSERPLAGNGDTRLFIKKLQNESQPKGIVTKFVADGWGEPHNDLMFALASFGFLGGFALLLTYVVPAIIFIKRMSFVNPTPVRTAAAMGLAVCVGFLVFGIGETMLRSMRTVSFYSISIVLFMHLSYVNKSLDKASNT